MGANTLINEARKALDGSHPHYGWPVQDGAEQASARALLALAEQQQETNRHLASIAESLIALAAAATTHSPPPLRAPVDEPNPKRRFWISSRRKTA
ncbi:hypothetical protein [Streptomyces sp. NBC_01789]|uniref:hypothetical protein n=1 Tax=Streptomyces sp. NBC_01789 TaxID=2975941 RepID=UPI00225AB79A|nr:hypothetical protein [Streptomyces sp. NBC_01789]MCX4450667.1 hypothetical protein [Streptomyces sp. NBC_01789]